MAQIFFERPPNEPGGNTLRRLVELLDEAASGPEAECVAPMDVVDYEDRVEVIVDIPGVTTSSVRVIYSRGTLVVAGRKLPRGCEQGSVTFHLAERSFGRFVRTVDLAGAFDAGRATAAIAAGELRVELPRIDERRGRDIHIEVTGEPHANPVRR